MVLWGLNPDWRPPQQRDPNQPIQAELLAPMHTVEVKKLVIGPDNKIDLDKSTCDSKDGWDPLQSGVALKKIIDLWKARLPNAGISHEFRVLK
jgi:hypothetical protein